MAIENVFESGSEHRSSDDVRSDLTSVVFQVAVGITAVGWIAFWAIVARLHLAMGDYLSAGFVAIAFILPPVVGLGYYLRGARPLF